MICVLQLDSTSVAVVERMLAAGDLPNLAQLTERGQRTELRTPAADFAAGAFHSLYSGVRLADHGIFYPFQWSASEQRARYATAFAAPPPVWERFAGTGLRTLAIDPYESRPPAGPERPHGLFVCGWGFRERVVLPRWSHPSGAGRRLERRHGRGAEATEVFGRPRPRDLLRLRERLLPAPGRIAALAREQLAAERFDLAWLTFSAAHLAGHAFWDLSQLDPEDLDERTSATLAGTLEEVYAEVDAAVGSVLEALPDAADVIVVSPVGMDVNTSRADLLPEMLEAVLAGPPARPERDEAGGAIWRLRGAVPASTRARVAAAIPRPLALELTARLELRGHEWSRTRAFAHPADNQGYVRLNLAGRERRGIVAAGEADRLLDEIEQGLASFRRPDGSPAVAGLTRVARTYEGARRDRLPDLVVRWSDSPATGPEQLHSTDHGTVCRRGAGSGRSGNHTAGDAWALVVPGDGSSIEPSRPRRLEDVAATICERLGVAEGQRAGIAGEPLLAS